MRYASANLKYQLRQRADSYVTARIVFADGRAAELAKNDFWLDNDAVESSESSSFPIGLLIAKSISLSIVNDDGQWDGYSFYKAVIYCYSNFDLDNGSTHRFFLGTYTVITPETYGQAVQLTAVDDSYKTDREYSTTLTFPTTAQAVLLDAAQRCNIALASSAFTNDTFIVKTQPSGTFRSVIGELAALAGGNAKFDNYNRLQIIGYSLDAFTEGNLYGGVFDSSKPYATGNKADGGKYNPWNIGDVFNAGTFSELNELFDRYKTHYMPEWFDLTVEADDVVITGVQIEADGTIYRNSVNENYLLTLNCSIASGNEQVFVNLVGAAIIGFRFRPFSGDYISSPLVETMDLAILVDRRGNVYNTVITEVSYTFSGKTSLRCTAESPIRNQSSYSSSATRQIVELRNATRQQIEAVETSAAAAAQSAEQNAKTYADTQLSTFINGAYAQAITQLGAQIDSRIEIFFGTVVPALNNSPASTWTTSDQKAAHVDDLYYNTATGYCYRFTVSGSAYAWTRVKDSDITSAATAASNASTLAAGKATVYVGTAEPDSPQTGDLWLKSANDDILTYVNSAWVKYNKYTDNTALTAFINGDYANDIKTIESQIDGKAETWYQAQDPSSAWTDASTKTSHQGDIWFCTSNSGTYAQKTWMYSGTAWEEVSTEVPQEVFDKIDGKAQIFVAQPTPPYSVGDLWVQGSSGDILRCLTARASGLYSASDWVKASKYTDDSSLDDFIDGDYASDKKALTVLVANQNAATKAAAKTLSTLIAQGLGLFVTEEVQQDGSSIFYMHSDEDLAESETIWKMTGNTFTVSTDGGQTYNAGIDADGNILANVLSVIGINFSWAKGGQLTLGGPGNGSGTLSVLDENGEVTGSWSNTGLVASGTVTSQGDTGNAAVLSRGWLRLYSDYGQSTARLYGIVAPMKSATSGGLTRTGMLIASTDDYVILGKYDESAFVFSPYYVANIYGNYRGITENNALIGNSTYIGYRPLSTGEIPSNAYPVQFGPKTKFQFGYNLTTKDAGAIEFLVASGITGIMTIDGMNVNLTKDLTVTGAFTCWGSKSRAVDTNDYGTVTLNALETPNANFADVGSGTVGDDGTVTIFFDAVLEEVVAMKPEYQVLLTQTSEKETTWVQKKRGKFIVHGESGATFDWVLIAKQRDYETSRFERVETPDTDKSVGNGQPLIPDDNSALHEVESMIQQYNERTDLL